MGAVKQVSEGHQHNYTFFQAILFSFFGAGDGIQGLMHVT